MDNRLISLPKINLPVIRDIPFLGRVLENLTIIDYLAYLIAVILFVYLFKTVSGFRTLSVGINKEAAESLGTKGTRIQMQMVVLSGALCGLGGTVLSMGQVTMFTENMTSGRASSHGGRSLGLPIPATILSSLFLGLPGHRQARKSCQDHYHDTALSGTIVLWWCSAIARRPSSKELSKRASAGRDTGPLFTQ